MFRKQHGGHKQHGRHKCSVNNVADTNVHNLYQLNISKNKYQWYKISFDLYNCYFFCSFYPPLKIQGNTFRFFTPLWGSTPF